MTGARIRAIVTIRAKARIMTKARIMARAMAGTCIRAVARAN